MNVITTQRPPLNLFEVRRKEFTYDDEWTTVYEVDIYKVPKTPLAPERLVDTACIMTGLMISNPGAIANDDIDCEASVRIESYVDIPEYGSTGAVGTYGVSIIPPVTPIYRVGRKIYTVNDHVLVLDELATSGTGYVDTAGATSVANISTGLSDVATGEAFWVDPNLYVKIDATLAALIRHRYLLINRTLVPASDFASINLERQVMKSGDRIQVKHETQDDADPTLTAHFSFILNQREEYTREF